MYTYQWNEGLIVAMVEANISEINAAMNESDADRLQKGILALEQSMTVLRLSEAMEALIEAVSPVYDKATQRLDELLPDEHEDPEHSVELDLIHPNAEEIAQLGRRWFDQPTDDEKAQMLQRRVSLDSIHEASASGLPLTLVHRLIVNDIDIDTYQRFYEVQSKALSKTTIPQHVTAPWLMYPLQALQLMLQVCNRSQRDALNALVQEGRLQLMEDDPAAMSLCIATVNGCFIQLPSQDGRINFFELLHEFGHCLHFGNNLDTWLMATDLQQEMAAISFEIKALEQLKGTQLSFELPNHVQGLASPPHLRRAYYQQWLWRVHVFELALYQHMISTTHQLDELWQQCVGASQFEDSWRSQSHLFLTPFFIICYQSLADYEKDVQRVANTIGLG